MGGGVIIIYSEINSILDKAITTTNNLNANEYLLEATNLVYNDKKMSIDEKLFFLKKIDNIALARHLPT